jgi:hypothetical protein
LLVFVGNYGEVLKYNPEYAVDAQMHGSKEVLIFHPRSLGLTLPSDSIRPENFEKQGLVELMVMPRKGSGEMPPNLAQMCYRRMLSLDEMRKPVGVAFSQYKCSAGKGCSIVGTDWPVDTCEFDIDAPFHLQQVYSTSDKEFYVLSSGMDLGDPRVVDLSLSLMRSLSGPQGEVSPKYLDTDAKPRNPWQEMLPEQPWPKIWLFVNGLFLLVAALPLSLWRKRRKRIGISAILFANAFIIYGLAVTALWHWLARPLKVDIAIGVPAVCVAPLAAWLVARRLRAANQRALFVGTVLAGAPMLIIAFLARKDRPEPAFSYGPFFSYLFMFPVGLVLGIVFGSLIRFRQDGRNRAAAFSSLAVRRRKQGG